MLGGFLQDEHCLDLFSHFFFNGALSIHFKSSDYFGAKPPTYLIYVFSSASLLSISTPVGHSKSPPPNLGEMSGTANPGPKIRTERKRRVIDTTYKRVVFLRAGRLLLSTYSLVAAAHLVPPRVQIHDEVLWFWISVPDLALVAIWIPGHLLRVVAVLLVFGQQLVVLLRDGLSGLSLQRLAENHGISGKKKSSWLLMMNRYLFSAEFHSDFIGPLFP